MTTARAARRRSRLARPNPARIVAALTRYTGDFSWAEDLAQGALVEALVAWPDAASPTIQARGC